MSAEFRVVGQPRPQLEGPLKVSGQAVYTHDLNVPGMLHGAILRSRHAHARIRSIDLSKALAMPGVLVAISGNDFLDRKYINAGPMFADRRAMARGKVRFAGEEVAAVAAETLKQAQAALERIVVDYEVLPAVFDADAALAPDAHAIHVKTDLPKNIAQESVADFGDVKTAFENAAYVFDETFEHGVVAPICLETNGVLASFDKDTESLMLWAPTQAPFFVRKEVAHILDLEAERVHVRSVIIGGGFGGKSQAPEPIAIAAMLSKVVGRPVRILLNRQEEFLSGKSDHAKKMRVRSAVASNGAILGRHTEFWVDNGAYTHMGPAYMSAVRQRTCNLYRVDAAGFDGKLIHTNKVSGGSYRGMGSPQIIWAIETQIDEIAEKLGKDKLDYRIEIANRPGDETPQGWKIGTCALAECLEEAGRRIGWDEKKNAMPPNRGIGFASMINPSVGVLYAEGNFACVSIDLLVDGRLKIGTQSADCGTSQNTVLGQFVAEELGVDLEQIDVLHMDTKLTPPDLGSAASRVTFVSGNAAIKTANAFRDELVRRLAVRWGVSPGEIEFLDGIVSHKTDNARRLTLAEVANLEGSFRVEGRHDIDLPRPDSKTGYGHYAATYGFGAQAAEVEIDPVTGRIDVLKVVVVQDIGRVINPLALDGQMHGGIVQGIGMALTEELIFENGVPVNASLINYRAPRIKDTPKIETAYIETNDPTGPYGAKAGGEHSINPTPAAIANAVAHATGTRYRKLPITPADVLQSLEANIELPKKTWMRPYNLEVSAARSLYPGVLFPGLKKLGGVVGRNVKPCNNYDYLRPLDLSDALRQMANPDRIVKAMGGGTDLQVGLRQGVYQADAVVDIADLNELRGITVVDRTITIGASTTIAELIERDDIRDKHPMLTDGLANIATRQIRNVATIAGDLSQEKRCWFFRSGVQCYKMGGVSCPCYAVLGDNRHHSIMGAGRCAAPCVADAAPILTALGASVVIVGPTGKRRVGLEQFYRWSGETVVGRMELIAAIEVPFAKSDTTQVFEKFAGWDGDFADASVAMNLEWQGDRIMAATVSVGGVSPLPQRVTATEKALVDVDVTVNLIRAAAEKAIQGSLPLSDNQHKCNLIVNLTERAIRNCVAQRS
ncbi:MAG: 4-hydroxybenzoyl-CoA reductase subunit alpha [Alphaproteobacteria bacterium MarineAlpha4_Bin2]|mgnify:CR=1 FL=1|nr:MAG: 4-hydroxybenzoyl-CoA reductase subunit alpha [Alphaproteobacteria bacterium MarineAlpha4_Bin2]